MNYILNGEHGKKIAVIENEFGEISIDDQLVTENLEVKEDIISMDNGRAAALPRTQQQQLTAAAAASAAPFGAT